MPSKPKSKATGPSYFDLIKAAIVALKERGGSSRQAINKYVSAKKGAGFKSGVFNRALKTAVEGGKLIQVKGSFKLAAAAKKAAKKAAPKKKATTKKKTATKKKAAPKKKAATKKKTTKKKAPAKKTTKKKAAKKPAAKKKATKKKAAPKKKAAAKKK